MSWTLPIKTQAVAAALLGITLLVGTHAAAAKGCLKGAAVGAVAGHVAGHHAVLGAAAGGGYYAYTQATRPVTGENT